MNGGVHVGSRKFGKAMLGIKLDFTFCLVGGFLLTASLLSFNELHE